ncbi:MAG TPA: hypothetical protein VFE46_03415 [Pirellulales bacterium]|jgi:hypothetical protein|nr:hypothetical protein [Pirellulales bacterium]
MGDPTTQKLITAGLLFAAMAAVTALGAWVVSRFRNRKVDEGPVLSELLSNFRELHRQGKLSDQEFRNIKTLLAEKIQQQVKDNSEQG